MKTRYPNVYQDKNGKFFTKFLLEQMPMVERN